MVDRAWWLLFITTSGHTGHGELTCFRIAIFTVHMIGHYLCLCLMLHRVNGFIFWGPDKYLWVSEDLRDCCWCEQCYQMVRLFFNICPFATMKISPIMSSICQSIISILPNNKQIIKNLPKICTLFAKVVKFRQIWSLWMWVKIIGIVTASYWEILFKLPAVFVFL